MSKILQGEKPLFFGYSIYNSYQNFIGTSSHVGSYTFRRPCTGLRQAKPGQSGLDELSPACAATPAPPAPPAWRTHSAKRYPGETCAEVKARARLDNVRGAELNATPRLPAARHAAWTARACACPCHAPAPLRHLEKPHVKFFLRVLAPELFCFPGRTYVDCY